MWHSVSALRHWHVHAESHVVRSSIFVCVIFFQFHFFFFFQKFLSCFLVLSEHITCINIFYALLFRIWNLYIEIFAEIRSTFLISKKSNKTIIGVWRDQYQDLLVCKKWYWPPFCIGQYHLAHTNWAPSSEFVSLSIPSWQILTAHAQPFRGARDLAFCLKFPLDSLLVWVSSGGSGETARMHRLAWTFAARIGDKYQIRLTRPN